MSDKLKSYRIINISLAGVILCVFIYSGIFSYKSNNFPIHSFHETVAGETSISSGLSRSFSAIVRLEFKLARSFNNNGIPLFVFFVIQFFLRCFFYFFSTKGLYELNQIVTIDIIISVSLFIFYFRPFIIDSFRF